MTLQELLNGATGVQPIYAITDLKNHRYIPQPDVEKAKKALNPELHDIMNPILRPDKHVKIDSEDNGGDSAQKVIDTKGESVTTKTEKVARIAVALQKLIIKRAVSFLFGNPPKYNDSPNNDQEIAVDKALKRILYDVKSNSLNRIIASSMFGFKESAEYWYTVDADNNRYGFPAKQKVRCAIFSPAFGDTLYPYFDQTGDMVAFSRAYSRKETGDVATDYFETWTDTEHWLWVNGSDGWKVVDGYPKPVAIGKIPVVYGHQRHFETEDVDKLIDRLEKLLSNFADTNDYHAAPKIFVTGQINGWAKKGESGAVIEGDEGATMNYVSWQSAPESVKLEIETLLKLIYTITQTPDISFDAVKGLNVSGIALKLLFMDAHLKVQDKRIVFDEFLQRRVNILLAYIAQMNTSLATACESIEIEPEIIPYIITSDQDELNYWMTANGNQPVISQEESIALAGVSMNPAHTMEKIKNEQTAANSFTIDEPVDA